MTENLSPKEINQLIMHVALAACFKYEDDFLSEDQIIARNYAPTEYFAKSCIASLIDSRLIEFERRESVFAVASNESTLFIKRPVKAGEDLEGYIYKHAENIIDLLAQSDDYAVNLKALSQEVIACECIEYCEYYAKRAQLMLTNTNHKNARLRLLLLEGGGDIVNMLVWQAVKTFANKVTSDLRCVEFSEIIELAFDRYTYYKKANVLLEGYKRPSLLKTSVLAGFLEIYRNDL